MSFYWPPKDPDEVLDYQVDWSERLGSDTISTSSFTLVEAAGLTKNSETKTSTTATVWLSAGTLNQTATILNRITTAGGRTMDQTVTLKLKAK